MAVAAKMVPAIIGGAAARRCSPASPCFGVTTKARSRRRSVARVAEICTAKLLHASEYPAHVYDPSERDTKCHEARREVGSEVKQKAVRRDCCERLGAGDRPYDRPRHIDEDRPAG